MSQREVLCMAKIHRMADSQDNPFGPLTHKKHASFFFLKKKISHVYPRFVKVMVQHEVFHDMQTSGSILKSPSMRNMTNYGHFHAESLLHMRAKWE